ncbi:MAG TPA: hypothetical protein VHP36_08875 [Chitinispirillaceae bacterium]|nr:hypothetical protein [Chitinispirillaceae bacterium]
MRRIIFIVCLIMGYNATFAQVYNSASTLRPGRFSLGIAPIFFVNNGNDVGLFMHGGIGLARRMDLSLKFRLNNNDTYFGGDLEFAILKGMPTVSLAAGMHSYHDLGIDATFNLTFPIRKIASLYGCLDMDVEFNDKKTYFPVWGVIGFEVIARRHLGILMEIDIGITDPAENMFGIGLCVYF